MGFVAQEVRKGFTWGEVTIAPLLADEEEDGGDASGPSASISVGPDDRMVIPFQNENIYAYVRSPSGEKKVRLRPQDCTSPQPLTSERAVPHADLHDGARPDHRARLAERRGARDPRVSLRSARHRHGPRWPPAVEHEARPPVWWPRGVWVSPCSGFEGVRRGRTDMHVCSLGDLPFTPVAEYRDPASVVKEYASS